jgi:hypothetical protein
MNKNLYTTIEIQSKDEIEQLGTKEKYWIYDAITNEKKLFKIGRTNTGENWAEIVAYEIGKSIGLPVAIYELAKYNSRLGTISTNFVQNDERLIHGNELLVKIDKSYPSDRFYKVREYKLDTVLSLLKIIERAENIEIRNTLDNFIGYIVFDCLIANQDRHHENWGLIVGLGKKLRLAPSFDHASGFGCKVQEDEAKNRLNTKDKNYTVEAFCLRAKTPFYDRDSKQLNTIESCRVLAKHDKESFCRWVKKIVQVEDSFYEEIFEKITNKFINEYSKRFALEILKENTKRLKALKNEVCENE